MIIKVKTTAATLLILFLASIVVPFLGSLLVLSTGYALNKVVGIGLLPSTMLLVSTLFIAIVALGFGFITREIRANRIHFLDNDDDWEEENDDGTEEDEGDDMDWMPEHLKLKSTSQSKEKTGRNQPCPCGSQKKYKACCLNAAEPSPAENANSPI